MRDGPLAVYCRMYAVQQFLMCGALSATQQALSAAADESNTSYALPLLNAPVTSLLLAPLTLLLFFAPSAHLLVVLKVASLVVTVRKAPFIWDFQVWDLQTDLSIIAAAAAALSGGSPYCVFDLAGPAVRLQYIIFYACTALWKVNSTFFDTMRSCAPIFFVQLLDFFLPPALTPSWLPPLAVALAPVATVAVEFAIPALLAAPRATMRRAGLALGLLLHLLIAITPAPNNAGAFSVAVSCCGDPSRGRFARRLRLNGPRSILRDVSSSFATHSSTPSRSRRPPMTGSFSASVLCLLAWASPNGLRTSRWGCTLAWRACTLPRCCGPLPVCHRQRLCMHQPRPHLWPRRPCRR